MEDIFTLTAREEIEIAIRLVLAAVFGAAVGYERRSSDKPAGLRTLSLVAVGSGQERRRVTCATLRIPAPR